MDNLQQFPALVSLLCPMQAPTHVGPFENLDYNAGMRIFWSGAHLLSVCYNHEETNIYHMASKGSPRHLQNKWQNFAPVVF
jgi:hypothetical protein